MSYFNNSSYGAEVAQGNIAGQSVVHKFGRNAAVGTSFVPIALGGIYQTPQAASATTLRVKAGNANDTAAGSGAREITLVGIDETGAEVTEAVATAGAAASSATTATFMRLYRAYVSASGTYATSTTGSHSADIVIENGAGGTDWLTIDSTGFTKGQSEVGAYTVPNGYTGYINKFFLSADTTKTTDFILFTREQILDAAAPYEAMRAKFVGQTTGDITSVANMIPIKVTGPADVGFLAKIDAGTASVSVDFEILLIQD